MTRPHPALIEVAAGRPLPPVTDPQVFFMSAMEHRMTGLVWARAQAGTADIDPTLRRELATASLKTELRHRQLTDALLHANQLLAQKGIDVASFKGVTAERRFFDLVGDRPCWDVDLLVAPHCLSRVGELFETLDPRIGDGGRIQRLVDAGELQAMDLEFEGVLLDIHFDLFRLGFPIRRPELVWERTTELAMDDGRSVRVLDAEMSLIFALHHLNRDRFAKLLGLAEVYRIIERGNLDWDFIDGFVAGEGLDTFHAFALNYVLDTLGVNHSRRVPSTGWRSRVWEAIWPPRIRLLGEEGRLRFGRRGALLMPLLVRGRGRDAVRYLVRRAFPEPDKLALKHPDSRGPYPWRLVDARVRHRLRRRQERRKLAAARRR